MGSGEGVYIGGGLEVSAVGTVGRAQGVHVA